jgi:DNA-binding NarL/FixJ family response regulator
MITMVERSPRVLVVEDHRLLAETLALSLHMNGFESVETPEDLSVASVLKKAADFKPQVVLLELHREKVSMTAAMVAPLVNQGARVLLLTSIPDSVDVLAECLEAGAAGSFDKGDTFDHLIALIRDAALGHAVLEPCVRQELLAVLRQHRTEHDVCMNLLRRLSPRECEVLRSITEGKSAKDIARDRTLSLTTVRSQIHSILQKLGVNSQVAAVAVARRAGWIPIEQ